MRIAALLGIAVMAPFVARSWVPPSIVRSNWPKCGAFGPRIAAEVAAEVKRGGGGTAVVVGANTGPGPGGTDPMFKWLASDKAGAVLDKVFFLEPLPIIFRALQQNLRSVPKAIGLNVAVANASGVLNMYCLGIANDLGTTPGGQLVLKTSDAAMRLGVPNYATETCSLTRERLFSPSDFARSGPFGGLRALRNRTAYESLITAHEVQVITFAELERRIKEALGFRSRVLYLQIDAEGKDDELVLLALDTFPPSELPVAITFEIGLLSVARLVTLMAVLTGRGYSLCYDHKNLIAEQHASAPRRQRGL